MYAIYNMPTLQCIYRLLEGQAFCFGSGNVETILQRLTQMGSLEAHEQRTRLRAEARPVPQEVPNDV